MRLIASITSIAILILLLKMMRRASARMQMKDGAPEDGVNASEGSSGKDTSKAIKEKDENIRN